MTVTPTTLSAATGSVPPATASIHRRFLEKATPAWLLNATPERRAALKDAKAVMPDIYLNATPSQRKALHDTFTASFVAQTALDKTMAGLQDIDTFAEPLLAKALKDQYGLVVDVRKTWICLKKAMTAGIFEIELHTFEYLKISLLAAAQHNFEAAEAEVGAFHKTSGFLLQGTTPDAFQPTSLKLSVPQFLALCRSLDIGAKYQTYLKAFIQPTDPVKATALREQFIASKKATMRAAAEQALLQKDIDAADYAMVLSVIKGEVFPKLGADPVWFCDLCVMKRRLNDCVVFVPSEKYRYAQQCILYVPHDPKHPMKRFTFPGMEAHFKTQLTTPDTPAPKVAGPTSYQKFFSQFMPYADRPYYFSQFSKDAPSDNWVRKLQPVVPIVSELVDAITMMPFFHITNPAPPAKLPQLPEDDPYLHTEIHRLKGLGQWQDNIDLWAYLYERSQAQAIADAAAHAVPTASVDATVRAQKIAVWLNVGLFALTFVTAFIPVLGEITLAFMAGQLLYGAFEGAIEWSEGDRRAAKAYFIDLAENLLLLAATHGAGKGLSKIMAIQAVPAIEDLHSVKLPNGQTRLWRPDLAPYKSDVVVPPGTPPNALGQYVMDGKTYIRLGDALYEKTYDATLKKWRIKHPQDSAAYQPILEHNEAGAWRHTHERPLTWDRMTLLRRLGHVTDSFTDEQLRTIGEVSGVPDDLLRKTHVDGAPMPAVLADTLEQFKVDQEVDEVIAQIRRGAGSDSRYEAVVPFTVELPRWPEGRVVEVFEGPEPWGASQRYGRPLSAGDVRPTIKLTRADVRAGKLGQSVVAALSPEETTTLLGSASAWNGRTLGQIFNERLANQALKRRRALFDSLMRSRTPPVAETGVLGRRFPALSRRAVDELLGNASVTDRPRLDEAGKVQVPRRLDDQSRISLQQARLNTAIAGLHRETLASLDSDRLALHTLEKLPGWPGDLRIEVRMDSLRGQLLDSIGAEDATVTKYLVKDGDRFQARDERGETLNSLSQYSRNFYPSILHALPDNAREGLGILFTSEDELLQRTLADYARSHRSEMADILKQRVPRSRPSLRLPGGRLGYALSGRGAGAGDIDRLVTRVRDIYPNLSDVEARFFVQTHLANGEHPQQIFNLLANRQRELDSLRSALDPWAGTDLRRQRVVGNVIDCWRNGLARGGRPFSTLDLGGELALPALNADFSHVHTLRLTGAALLGDQGSALILQFPNVQRLELFVERSELNAVAERLSSLPAIPELALNSLEYRASSFSPGPSSNLELNFSPEVLQSINRLTQLERLSLSGNIDQLDVSGLVNLRSLSVSGSLATWPEGVLGLEHLENLSLSSTQIGSVPPAMFTGHERLWRGLRMNWGNFEPQAFMEIYEHVHENPAHLVDEETMARRYVEGSLRHMTGGDSATIYTVLDEFRLQRVSASDQIERINALRTEHDVLSQALQSWRARIPVVPRARIDPFYRRRAVDRILASWREGLGERLAPGARPGPSTQVVRPEMRLDLSGAALGDLPPLPAAGFSHVRQLDLTGVRVPLTELEGFLARFNRVERLNLANNDLTELPSALTGMTSLGVLDFPGNLLQVTPTIQARLNGLTNLTFLNLQRNPIRVLDISRLTRLTTLDLGHTAIREWPAGALQSPSLRRLDLSYSAVTTVPEAALTGRSRVLVNTSLRGCRLTAAARANVQAIGPRLYSENPAGLTPEQMALAGRAFYLERPLGIPRVLLEEGRTGGDPEFFPEGTEQNPSLLLPLPIVNAEEQAQLTAAARMQRLDPSLDTTQAIARIDELSGDGLSALQIQDRLVAWERQQREWIQTLNEWLDIRGVRDNGRWISAVDRRRAADRLLTSWRYTLRERPLSPTPQGLDQIDLSGLTLGDLPTLPGPLAHVSNLNLSGVMITDQGSNGFLRTFSHIDSLTLDNNGLNVLPDAVGELRSLTRLDAVRNRLRDASALRQQLINMPMLENLNLSENTLGELDVSGMSQLETLNLRDNVLMEWPTGVFQAPRLRTLNLRNNRIETIPGEAFQPRHQPLMASTDLYDNLLLEQEFEDLRSHLRDTGNGLGFSLADINRMIEGYEVEASEGSDEHPEIETPQVQRDRWFVGVAEGAERHQVWDDLRAAPDGNDFFFTLAQLRNTTDFAHNRAAVTDRVWRVLDALHGNEPLRQEVFARATAAQDRMTCGDGRILAFNDLETTVYEFNVLNSLTRGQEGPELFRLARRMSRLDAVEAIAQSEIRRQPRSDAAEIRLAYRIGLAQRLGLPDQPQTMRYANLANVTPDDINTAYNTVTGNESTPAFDESLVRRTYWVDHLRRIYPGEFAALANTIAGRIDALDELYPEGGENYLREYAELGEERAAEERALAIRLSAQERMRLGF